VGELDGPAQSMTVEEAVEWLRRVDGELYRTPPWRGAGRAWVAVVRMPAPEDERTVLIVALGKTAQEAASAAANEWRSVHGQDGPLH